MNEELLINFVVQYYSCFCKEFIQESYDICSLNPFEGFLIIAQNG